MPNRLLHLILVGVALSREPNGSYFVNKSKPYLALVYTFSDDATKVEILFNCGVGPRPTKATFAVTKKSDVFYLISLNQNLHWLQFIDSFEKTCPDYLPLEEGDLSEIKYDTKFDHPSIHLKGQWLELAHREPPSH
ncbi:hypothetical protein Pmar_PMAR007069 [Perkinsus marinus ATCC 50983]|uniref:Uncharacterized protein n=1 Tax=Perkinsus marinus (strain ATCC 50983 / TXsc) TaxID=423536 RepID=C5KZP4_PERM5|nr:hypothetical protein Pmar_PMAR007069 [Perkinsus marinus ATCC 50983]EER10072.1 hypothetical protein Pmar_PMAR007069 [Perkinsus marinus ATCC 50983]|eukprot:XP_002778277.1 hypothetical protein Pmar_PMAR007069 [Perkinsus marinus ATCC 50983]